MTLKLCVCTLILIMVLVIAGDVLQGVRVGNTMKLDHLEFRRGNPVEFEELVTSWGLNVEGGIGQPYAQVGNSSRSPDKLKAGRNQ